MLDKITFAITTKIDSKLRESFFHKCLESIINQSNNNWEILISDDWSTISINYKKYEKYSNIKIFKQEKNLWMFNWWNFLLNKCKTKWFIPMWDDDIVKKDFIDKCYEKINKKPKIDCIYFDIENINSFWNIISELTTDMKPWFHKHWNQFLNYRVKNSLNFSYTFFISVIKTNKLKDHGWFKDFWTITDTYISYIIAKNFNVYYIKDSLMKIRKHKNNASNNIKRIFKEQKKLIPFLIKEFWNELTVENLNYLKKLNKTIKYRYIKNLILSNTIQFLKLLWYKKY